MADNNSYDVNVTLDDFNAFITADKVVDENNQQLSNYVCNVTYTSLKDGQIDAIGGAIETAIENKLPKAALSGSYNDLNDVPENNEGKRQGFHEVAFTGEYSILKHKPDLKDLAFLNTVPYNKIDEAPSLINQPFIYDEENEQYTDEKAPFDKIAFTGSWNDIKNKPNLFDWQYSSLIGAPSLPTSAYPLIVHPADENHIDPYEVPDYNGPIKPFAEIAFSGDYESLKNKPSVIPSIVILDIFNYSTNSDVQDIGTRTFQLINYDSLTTRLKEDLNTDINLKEQIEIVRGLYNTGYMILLKIKDTDTLITSIDITYENNIMKYYIINLEPDFKSNYNLIRGTNTNISNLQYNYKHRCIIIDIEFNILYSIYETE